MISKTKFPLSGLLFLLVAFTLSAQSQHVVRCFTVEADQHLREQHPRLGTLEEFEEWLAPRVRSYEQQPAFRSVTLTVPVVFHIIHNGEAVGTGDNLSAIYVNAQIEQLNNDFRRILGTSGYNNNPVGADSEIEFCPATVAPDGSTLTEPGINRINRNTKGWTAPPYGTCGAGGSFNEAYIEGTIKPQSQWDPNQYFNIWVMDINCGILGYAQFPSQSGLSGLNSNGGAANTDGVVLLSTSVGSTTAPNPQGNTYNQGRTATHEVGHFFGLRHIWGDGGCGIDDYCADTPESDDANYGCPTTHVSCGSTDMVRNYMDYTDDACMNIFTLGQKARMQAVMANSPRRASLVNSTACSGGGSGPTCSTTISSFPYTESFENGAGNWVQSTADDFDWTNRSGSTPSSGTGPSTAAEGFFYMYMEASSPNYPEKRAILESPCFDLTGKSFAEIRFQYHMLGNATGTLALQASTNGTSWTTIWSRSGGQGSDWAGVSVGLSNYGGESGLRLRFSGITGNSWQGDICIDDITITASNSSPPVANFSAAPTTITEGQSLTFSDLSANNPTAWSWSFPGGSPAVSSTRNPTVTYNTAGTYNVSLTATNASGSDTETKTGYITVVPAGGGGCSGGVASFPYNESFESGLGDWTQGSGDDFNWTRNSGSTPSSGTGPGSAAQGNWYIYAESSSPNYSNKVSLLNSPCFDLSSATNAAFSFRYHMYGASSMGSLQLQVRQAGSSTWSTVWSRSGNQGNTWLAANIDLSAFAGNGVELRYVGTTGTTWQGDMAIDDIALSTEAGGGCSDVTLTIILDDYPEETDWEITDASGSVVASGGPYGSQPDGATVVQTACLSTGCYDLIIYDSYGDGICCNYGTGSYVLEDAGGAVLAAGSSFGFQETTNFCVNVGARAGSGIVSTKKVAGIAGREVLHLFPNPAKERITVTYESKENRAVRAHIVSMLGQVVQIQEWELAAGQNQKAFDISDLQPGTYFLQVEGDISGTRFVVVR
ncbi:MAG: T9SS type A sorting domain-containing protein [Phaeodactylibacter sp.]|nr:T9SS type A sorting domain-containing protein [Phaeodactylibacter sp.]MCB9048046.1 T9SS type A sorting domain-containing protein [Lewinellaceae bacterium]